MCKKQTSVFFTVQQNHIGRNSCSRFVGSDCFCPWKHNSDSRQIGATRCQSGRRTWICLCVFCEEVGVVKRVHTLSGGVHRLATALKEVEEVQEEVQEIKDEGEDEEVEGNGGLKFEGEPHTSYMDEMTCATPLSYAVQCVNQDDTNLTNKQENCALTCQCSCALS